MEHGACNVIHIDRRAHDEYVRLETLSKSRLATITTSRTGLARFPTSKSSPADVLTNIEAILSIFGHAYICSSGRSALSTLSDILPSTAANTPTFIIIDVPYDQEQRMKRLSREPRAPALASSHAMANEPDDIYAMHLLTHIAAEISSRNMSRLVVPVVMLTGLDCVRPSSPRSSSDSTSNASTDTVRLSRYLDAGAVDVLSSPLSKDRLHALVVHGYRLQKEVAREEASFMTAKRNRKLSWVGVDDAKPYAYLREAMVSNLMTGICNPDTAGDSLRPSDLRVDRDRRLIVENTVATWAFSAHDFTDDELLYAALVMLKHALQMHELEHWNMTDDQLIVFLLASRIAYNEFVKYHNFRHVVDVLQALFHFLVRIGTLPPYPPHAHPTPASSSSSPVARLLQPFDALTLLISAIGHDVGHPGVNNAFLVVLNAPLAQLYNDRSVLESFHCAAYSQILRRYWPSAFADTGMRKLMINNILATDMGLHFKYMCDLGTLQKKIDQDDGVLDGWSAKVKEEQKDLVCGLLIKCADVCNVAREFDTAARWANILTDEFSNQGLMEQELQMPSCLFGGPPVRDDMIKLGESQIGFMDIFATPLFQAIMEILPPMRFAVEQILANRAIWERKTEEERQKKRRSQSMTLGMLASGFVPDPPSSPRSSNAAHYSMSKIVADEDSSRRASTGSYQAALSTSRRSSSGFDKASRRSSAAAMPGQRALVSRENQSSSRRGSGDPSLMAILVTQSPNTPESSPTILASGGEDCLKGDRKDMLTRPASTREKGHVVRPLTAPSQARRNQKLYPHPQPSTPNHSSEIDLSHAANGNLDGSKLPHWDSHHKLSGDSLASHSDTSRHPSWWRHMASRRTVRDARNGDSDGRQHKELLLDMAPSTTDSNTTTTTTATCPSPGKRTTTTGKIKSFFKRKPTSQKEPEKLLSSFGSSSQLRTPPTHGPGHSFNSED